MRIVACCLTGIPQPRLCKSRGEVVLPEKFPGWKDGQTVKLTTVNDAQCCEEPRESFT